MLSTFVCLVLLAVLGYFVALCAFEVMLNVRGRVHLRPARIPAVVALLKVIHH